MLETLILVAATTKEPPPIVVNESQRMAIIDMVNTLKIERDEAETRGYHWYKKARECEGKTRI